MTIRYQTYENYHGKTGIGSTRLRVHNLIKFWPEAGIYQYGENPDVLIFQKVYCTADYKFPALFEKLKILDICDPDWLDQQAVKETIDVMDGVTCPTEALADFLRQLTDKPVKVIPDRHDITNIPKPKTHVRTKPKVVWYGYKQNAELLRFAIPSLESRGLELTVISNDDPSAWRWANEPEEYQKLYKFQKYDEETIINDLSNHDICLLPAGTRPQDRFKSNNRTTRAWLAGIPVATDAEELDRFLDPAERNNEAQRKYHFAIEEYTVVKSVTEMTEFIEELNEANN